MMRFLGLALTGLLLLTAPVHAAPPPTTLTPLLLKDEGTFLGFITSFNCVGSGVACTRSGLTGTLTVLATESPLTFTGPQLSRSANTVSCANASASTAGCVTAAAQTFGGDKTFTGHILPAVDNTTNLGSAALRYNSAYFAFLNDSTGTTRTDVSGTTTWVKGTAVDGASAVAYRVGNVNTLANATAKVWAAAKDGTSDGSGDVAWVTPIGKLSAYGFIVRSGSIDDSGGTGHIDFNAIPNTTLYSQVTDHQFRVGGVVMATINAGGTKIGTTGTAISASYRGTATNPAQVNALTCGDTAVTVTGAAVGAECSAGTPAGGPGANLSIACYVSATNTAQLHICNNTAGNLTPTTGTYSARVFNP